MRKDLSSLILKALSLEVTRGGEGGVSTIRFIDSVQCGRIYEFTKAHNLSHAEMGGVRNFLGIKKRG